MKSRKKIKIISSIFCAVTISGLAIGLGLGLSSANKANNNNVNNDSLKISPTQTTYYYYGNSSSNNSVISFDANNTQSNLSTIAYNNTNDITYQWQYSLSNTNDSWVDFAGANQDTFNLSTLPQDLTSVSKFYVRCEVTTNKNTTTSNVITIDVKNFSDQSLSSYVPTVSNLNTSYIINLQNNANNTIYFSYNTNSKTADQSGYSKITDSNNLYWQNSSDSNNIISFDINNISNLDQITNIELFSNNISSSNEQKINGTFSSEISKYLTLDSNTNVATFSIPENLFANSWLSSYFPNGLTSINFKVTISKDSNTFNLQSGNINFYNINPSITTNDISLDQNTISTDKIQFSNNLTSLFNSNEIQNCTSNIVVESSSSSVNQNLSTNPSDWKGGSDNVSAPTSLSVNETYYYAIGVNFSVTINDTTYNLIVYSNISNLKVYSSDLTKYKLPSFSSNQDLIAMYNQASSSQGYNGIIPYATASTGTGSLDSQGAGSAFIPGTTPSSWQVGAYWMLQNYSGVDFLTTEATLTQETYNANTNSWDSSSTNISKYLSSSDLVFDDQNGYIYLNLTSLTSTDWAALNGQNLQITIPYTIGNITASLTLPTLIFMDVSSPFAIYSNSSSSYNTTSTSNNIGLNLMTNNYLSYDISNNDLTVSYQWEYYVASSSSNNYSDSSDYSDFNGATSSTFSLTNSNMPSSFKTGDKLYIMCVVNISLNYISASLNLKNSYNGVNFYSNPYEITVS